MNFNFDNPYIEYDSDDKLYSFYEMQGVNKINELSRQLRSFLNYKAAIIQYRFCTKNIPCYDRVDKKYKEIEVNFKHLASKFIKLLSIFSGNRNSYEAELQRVVNNLVVDKKNKELISDLKTLTEKLFTSIHILSEQEIHLHPILLKFIINLTQEACKVNKILNHWASRYYEELRVNYVQLHNELIELIPERQAEKIFIKKYSILEEKLKQW